MTANDFRFICQHGGLTLVLLDKQSGSSMAARLTDDMSYKLAQSLIDILNTRNGHIADNAEVHG